MRKDLQKETRSTIDQLSKELKIPANHLELYFNDRMSGRLYGTGEEFLEYIKSEVHNKMLKHNVESFLRSLSQKLTQINQANEVQEYE